MGSPSARRLTRSNEKPVAETKDLRKRSKTGTGKKTPGMGAMGALAPAMLKNRLLAPAIFGHFSTVGKNCGC